MNNEKLTQMVLQFRLLALPGQHGMHMGTAYMVNDLEAEINRLEKQVEALREAIKPLANIADRYDDEGLDEARPSWRDKGIGGAPFDKIELFTGRGGAQLLTLADAFAARVALIGKKVKP